MSDDHAIHVYVPISGVDESTHSLSLHWKGARSDTGPADANQLESAMTDYARRDGAVAAIHHQHAGRVIPGRDGFQIKVTDAKAWMQVTSSSVSAIQIHGDKRNGALTIANIELTGAPRPNQEKAAGGSFAKGANTMNDSRFSGSVYKPVETFRKALTEARNSPIRDDHSRGPIAVDNSSFTKAKPGEFAKAVGESLARAQVNRERPALFLRKMPGDTIPTNYSSKPLSAEGAELMAGLTQKYDLSNPHDLADAGDVLLELKALLEAGAGAGSFSKAWSPVLSDADGMRALPETDDQVRSAMAQLFGAHHFFSDVVDEHPRVPAVYRCKAAIKKAIAYCEKGDIRQGFRAVADAMDEHGRVVTALPGDTNVARVGLALNTAYQMLDKVINLSAPPPGPEAGSMGVAVPGGSDKVSKLDVNCFGVPNRFLKALNGARRTSLAHDAGVIRR